MRDFLLEAQREVDEMLPGTPRIAPKIAVLARSILDTPIFAAARSMGFYYSPLFELWNHPDGRVVYRETAELHGGIVFEAQR